MVWPSHPPFTRVLIANRGEIAVRVIRTCARLGIRSVAVFSEADRDALHVRMADEAHYIGPGPAAESYLSIPRILDVARRARVEAIHPGYGFLSEQAAFAEVCAAAGLVFVGPSPAAMRLLGDKAAARHLAATAGVPTVPGYDGPLQDDDTLLAEAARIGFSVLVKAAAGGGGRGMRIARTRDDLPEALAAARREAHAAFGDGTLLLERLLTGVRHVEVQVLGDHHGGLIHLGERDCSVQRRHQKVIEESPAPGLTSAMRTALGDAAISVARAAGYTNAGTCEFLVAGEGQFWFIEMNARLQVEHPVTEAVTGIDLVESQLSIASGQPLPWRQEDIALSGHAVECRLYAEDPHLDGLPATGRLRRLRPPAGSGVRHDGGYADGDTVPPFYDTMIAKVIASGPNREVAIKRARAAVDGYEITGLPTNRPLLNQILTHPTFLASEVTTDFLSSLVHPLRSEDVVPLAVLAAAAAWDLASSSADDGRVGPWAVAGQGIVGFWLAGGATTPQTVIADRDGASVWRIRLSDQAFQVTLVDVVAGEVLVRQDSAAGDPGALACGGEAQRCCVSRQDDAYTVLLAGQAWMVRRAPPPTAEARTAGGEAGGESTVLAPLPGRVVAVLVTRGDHVVERQPLVVVEAMKIERTLAAPRGGVVAAVHCTPGGTVSAGQVLVELALR